MCSNHWKSRLDDVGKARSWSSALSLDLAIRQVLGLNRMILHKISITNIFKLHTLQLNKVNEVILDASSKKKTQ